MTMLATFILGFLSLAFQAATEMGRNNASAEGFAAKSTVPITDADWTTGSLVSDCTTGMGDETWELTLTRARRLTVTVADCCCTGDYFEVFVDDMLIGTTPNPGSWGCQSQGSLSVGSYSRILCPGTHVISVRDVGFIGHSAEEIAEQDMCPAGFTISGTLSESLRVQLVSGAVGPNLIRPHSCGPSGFKQAWEDQNHNRFELACTSWRGSHAFLAEYVSPMGNRTLVGLCPWMGGINTFHIYTTGDNDDIPGDDCFLGSFYRSEEPGYRKSSVCDQRTSGTMDWNTWSFDIASGDLTTGCWQSSDGLSGLAPDESLAGCDPTIFPGCWWWPLSVGDIEPTTDDPETMDGDPLDPCDLDRDGDCDADDLNMMEQFMGNCVEGGAYNELADADHDGCVTKY